MGCRAFSCRSALALGHLGSSGGCPCCRTLALGGLGSSGSSCCRILALGGLRSCHSCRHALTRRGLRPCYSCRRALPRRGLRPKHARYQSLIGSGPGPLALSCHSRTCLSPSLDSAPTLTLLLGSGTSRPLLRILRAINRCNFLFRGLSLGCRRGRLLCTGSLRCLCRCLYRLRSRPGRSVAGTCLGRLPCQSFLYNLYLFFADIGRMRFHILILPLQYI